MADQQAGWYPDPAGDASKLRYWDGAQWTNDFTDVPAGAQPVAEPVQPAAQPVQPYQPQVVAQETPYATPAGGQAGYSQPYMQPVQKSNTLAIVALVCGIVGLCIPLAAIAAIVTGVMARKNPDKKGMALAGMILGIAGLVLLVVYIIVIAVFGNITYY